MGTKLNLNNRKFGKLTVLKETNERNINGDVYWLCECECGNKRKIIAYNLAKANGTKGCPSCVKKGWKSPFKSRIKMNCLQCGKEFEIKKYRIGEAKFCSGSCNATYNYDPEVFTMKNKRPWNRMYTDEMRHLTKNFSQSIRNALKGKVKNTTWMKFIPYSIHELRAHLEQQFRSDMNWENYGRIWQIDHIIPIAVFNFKKATDIDFQKCWALSNLQPLSREENFRKNSKLEKPFQPSFAF